MKLFKAGLWPAVLGAAWLASAASNSIDPKLYIENVRYLASPELRGRGSGSAELEKAGQYIADKFKDFGLRPADGKSYFQPLNITTSAQLGKNNRLSVAGAKALRLTDEYLPMHFSSAAAMQGAMVFAGYGITAPDFGYDDYAGIDVKGKVVVILRHEPQENDEKSKFAGKMLTQHAQFPSKASNAKMHGAAGIILINDLPNHQGDEDRLEKFGLTGGPMDTGIPFVQVKASAAEPWFTAAGKTINALVADIDDDLKPATFEFPAPMRVDANVDVERLVKSVNNVAAYLPGETGEYIVIGAHYDHLGLGGQHSLAPSMTGTVHPGADDNASGTSGLIELARWYSKQPKQKRGILFLAFTAEEIGLLGSAHWAANPQLPMDNATAMLNMDMIGRIRDGKVYIGGAATGSGFRALLEKVTPKHNIKVDFADGPASGSSDHSSFIAKKVPSLFFFSGLHTDYHKPSDTWEKIDGEATARLLGLVVDIADELRAGDRPQFTRPAAPVGHGGSGDAGPVTSSTGSGYGAYFGSVPDFAEGIKGVKFADVTPNSPAAKAGLEGGDIMTEFDGKPIQNLYDFTYALRGKKPGDEVMVKIERAGKTIEVKVLLGRRS